MEEVKKVKFKLIKHLITFPVYVNGKGPFNFWLDTGGPGLIIKRSLARELGLNVIDTGMRGIGAGGEVQILVTTVKSLEFAGIRLENVQARVLDLRGWMRGLGLSSTDASGTTS
ncbi:MAG TPA: hypothetical protein ENG61_03435 [Candidatus Korarchaeota archaeon]|nr:MAG: hypothetical protein DRO05_06590 [Candidatus Korarchaeota archaeon]HDD69391.1 hypothetical protein [Candidatus Korarchaeota archaeon]